MTNDNPLRIVNYLPGIRLAQGGVVRAVLDSCAVMAEQGHTVTLFTYEPDDLPKEWLTPKPGQPHAIVLPVPTLPGRPLSRAAMKLVTPVLKDAHALHLHAPWLDGNRQFANVARRFNVPYVVTIHGMLDDWSMSQRGLKKRIYMALFGTRFLDNAAIVHCTAEAELTQARKWFNNPNTVVLPYIINLTPYETLPGPAEGETLIDPALRDRRKILFLSRLHEKKGVHILLEAVAQLKQRMPVDSFALILAGSGDEPYVGLLHRRVAELKLEDCVRFVGLIVGDAKLSLYQAADVFVLPTSQENFGLVLVEALACGTPVITTQGTDIWQEVLTAGGVIVDQTAPALADALQQLLSKPLAELEALRTRERRWVLDTFHVTRMEKGYNQLYQSMQPPQRRGTPPAATFRPSGVSSQ